MHDSVFMGVLIRALEIIQKHAVDMFPDEAGLRIGAQLVSICHINDNHEWSGRFTTLTTLQNLLALQRTTDAYTALGGCANERVAADTDHRFIKPVKFSSEKVGWPLSEELAERKMKNREGTLGSLRYIADKHLASHGGCCHTESRPQRQSSADSVAS